MFMDSRGGLWHNFCINLEQCKKFAITMDNKGEEVQYV